MVMAWFTMGEIVLWLVLAAGLGVVLGWLLHEVWNRTRAAEVPVEAPAEEPTASGAADARPHEAC